MKFFDELIKLLESQMKTNPAPVEPPEELTQEVIDSYKVYGFDAKNPPSDNELGHWAAELVNKWHTFPDTKVNLPLAALCISYNMNVMGKLNQFDQMNLKTLLSAVYNMGYNMGKYNMKNPFHNKPKPQELN